MTPFRAKYKILIKLNSYNKIRIMKFIVKKRYVLNQITTINLPLLEKKHQFQASNNYSKLLYLLFTTQFRRNFLIYWSYYSVDILLYYKQCLTKSTSE